ncbi:hypothetical protein BX666DRAFT_1907067 [Dichotomocladium elegans]|nr:hypothetical protein BX666DRAFT_1907067 [Dichotomocladium elegans]
MRYFKASSRCWRFSWIVFLIPKRGITLARSFLRHARMLCQKQSKISHSSPKTVVMARISVLELSIIIFSG